MFRIMGTITLREPFNDSQELHFSATVPIASFKDDGTTPLFARFSPQCIIFPDIESTLTSLQ
jgi:hypothetical protein